MSCGIDTHDGNVTFANAHWQRLLLFLAMDYAIGRIQYIWSLLEKTFVTLQSRCPITTISSVERGVRGTYDSFHIR